MNPALQKTLTFLLLILAGYLLQSKIRDKRELSGVKTLILGVILPATIFVALLKVRISVAMIALPLMALAFNGLLYYAAAPVLPLLGFERGTPAYRTMRLLVPSLAPGLSVFPFILEYLGDGQLALAALADVGNKVFVLIILYMVAMNWYYRSRNVPGGGARVRGRREKLKDLGLSLLREPVNMVIVVALLMLSLGLGLNSLPGFVEGTVARLASLMSPIVLLFIGMAVRFHRREVALILRVLCFRAALAMAVSGGVVLLLGLSGSSALLAVVFGQCAVSFWPFAHMSAVEGLREPESPRVFDLSLGLNVLAFSLPFSTVVILSVLSFGELFAAPGVILPVALVIALYPVAFVVRHLGREVEVSTS